MPALKPATPAPDFALLSTPDQQVRLSDLRGKPVVLVFYPADWSPVCSDQLALYNANFTHLSCLISSQRVRLPACMAFTMKKQARRSEHCSCSTRKV